MTTISFAITVKDEIDEIQELLSFLSEHGIGTKYDKNTEIAVLMDSNCSIEVETYIKNHENVDISAKHSLDANFAKHKNYLNSICTKEYIFQIDADEVPCDILIDNLFNILEGNPGVDLFLVPRVNVVTGITTEHINKWGWKTNEYGWVNFPDYQSRLYKNKEHIKWKGNVHEKIIGFNTYTFLPAEEEYSLYHIKDIKRQELQNKLYETMEK